METMSDCCEGLRSSLVSRRGLLLGGASFAAWAYLPKFARAADGRDPRLVVVILRGALDGLATVAPIGDPEYAGLHGSIALTSSGPNGFADSNAAWAAPEGIKLRLDISAQIASRLADGVDPRDLLELVAADAASVETRKTIERAESRQQALALLLMSPEFQRR